MKIKIIRNPTKPWAKKLASGLPAFLKSRGHEVVETGADATICIGGDGTILYSNNQKLLEGRVLGIGTSHSYICQINHDYWQQDLVPLLESSESVETMTLEGEIRGEWFSAINDFVVHATNYRVVDIAVSCTGTRWEYEGDGIIISTSLGSTGYAYSAGGEKFSPLDRNISLVPIAPYKRTFSSQVVGEDEVIEIKAGENCAFIVDGIFVRELKKDEVLRITKGKDIPFFKGVGSNG